MVAIKLHAVIGEDRRLVIDLPPDTPTGSVEILIQPEALATLSLESTPLPPYTNPAREAARAKMLAAGILVTEFNFELPEDFVPLSPEELLKIGTPPPGARSILDDINEDRGEW